MKQDFNVSLLVCLCIGVLLSFVVAGIPGTDGYYLVVQATQVWSTGHLKIANGDVVPFLVAGIYAVVRDYAIAVKALYAVLAGSACFAISRSRGSYMCGPAALITTYETLEFPKMGIALLLCFLALALKGRRGVAAYACACIVHPAAAVAAWIPANLLGIPRWIGVLATLIAYLVASYSRANLIAEPVFVHFLLEADHALILRLGVALLVVQSIRSRFNLPLLIALIWPASAQELFGFSERAFLFQLLVCSFESRESKEPIFFVPLTALASVASLLILPNTYSPSFSSWTREIEKQSVPMLVSPRGFKFFYSANTGRDAIFFEPDSDWNPSKVFRLVQGVTMQEILFFGNRACFDGRARALTGKALLIREDCWRAVRERISRDLDPGLYEIAWNNELHPYRARPKFLQTRGKWKI